MVSIPVISFKLTFPVISILNITLKHQIYAWDKKCVLYIFTYNAWKRLPRYMNNGFTIDQLWLVTRTYHCQLYPLWPFTWSLIAFCYQCCSWAFISASEKKNARTAASLNRRLRRPWQFTTVFLTIGCLLDFRC